MKEILLTKLRRLALAILLAAPMGLSPPSVARAENLFGVVVTRLGARELPFAGVDVRLCQIGGSQCTGWATTRPDGQFVMNVPYGTYALEGRLPSGQNFRTRLDFTQNSTYFRIFTP